MEDSDRYMYMWMEEGRSQCVSVCKKTDTCMYM